MSVCVNADRMGNWHPVSFFFFLTNESHLENFLCICEKSQEEKFFCYFFFHGCQHVLMQIGLGNWHPLFFNYYITNEWYLEN